MAEANANKWLVVFLKEPKAGRVKTRLSRGLGTMRATMLYRHLIARAFRHLSGCPRWQFVAAITPDAKPLSLPSLDRADLVIGQGDGGLGTRMQRIFNDLPPGPVVLIGTDIPDVQPADIAQAFRALERHEVVIGPADDGGYWLIGMAAHARRLNPFHPVRWSTEHAAADTLANLPDNCRIATLRVLTDLDEREDFINWTRTGGRISR